MNRQGALVIIGGGLAGLAAAVELSEHGFKPVLIERRAYLGGRASSFPHGKIGEEIDIGQHVFLRCCSAYIRFLRKIGAWDLVRLQPRLHVEIRTRSGERGAITGSALPGMLYLAPSFARFPFLSRREKLQVARALAAARFARRERVASRTFAEWLTAHGQDENLIAEFWDFLILPTLNARAPEASAAMGLMVLQEAFLKRHGPDLGYACVGLSRIAARAAEFIRRHGGQVILNKGINSLHTEQQAMRTVIKEVELSDGTRLAPRLVISAVPPVALLKMLPQEQREDPFFARLRELRWNPIVNLYLWFDRPVLRDEQDLVAFWESPLQWIFNRSRILRLPGPGQSLCCSLSGAGEYVSLSPENMMGKLLPELRVALPNVQEARLQRYLVIKQPEATVAVTPEMARYRPPPETPIANLLLAGDWTATGWPSTMEGAVRSGRAAAARARVLFGRERRLRLR